MRPNYGGANEDNVNLLHALLHSVPLILLQATTDPHLCQRFLDTHRQVWVSVLWGQCSFLLGPGVQKVLFLPFKTQFPQSCVSSGGSVERLMMCFSKRAYATARSAALKTPTPEAGHCWPIPPQETLKHSVPRHYQKDQGLSGSPTVGMILSLISIWDPPGHGKLATHFMATTLVGVL